MALLLVLLVMSLGDSKLSFVTPAVGDCDVRTGASEMLVRLRTVEEELEPSSLLSLGVVGFDAEDRKLLWLPVRFISGRYRLLRNAGRRCSTDMMATQLP